MRGYAGKMLEVDLSSERIRKTKLSRRLLRKYLGGRGLATKLLWDRLGKNWEEINPLGPENMLLLLTGPMTGYVPGARLCISGKSPQSNGVVGSTVGGEFGVEIRCAGYDGVIFEGRSEKPVYLFIKDSETELVDASHIWGKDCKDTYGILIKEVRKKLHKLNPKRGLWKEPKAVYIGPAGEHNSRIAVVIAKWAHAAGYGGYGSVMGSKNLKAVVVKGTGPLPDVVNMEKVSSLIEKILDVNFRKTSLRPWGTGYLGYEVGSRLSSEPVKNWQEEWHDKKSFGVNEFEKYWVKKFWGDFGCPITCLKIASIKSGPFKNAITDNPDYENQAYLGPNLGIFKAEDSIYLTSLADDLGLCGIQLGNVLGFSAELYEKGILTKNDLDGVDIKWGNTKAFAKLVQMIAYRQGLGDILAEGTHRAALKIGKQKKINLMPYAVVVKGIGVGAHGVRSQEDYPSYESYACSVQGGDHTSTAYNPLDHGNSELRAILYDSGVFCWFNFFEEEAQDIVWEFIEATTGWHMTPELWFGEVGLRILHIQRALLLLGGPDLKWSGKTDDTNPPRFYESLKKGPYKGKALNKEKFVEAKNEYYSTVGWDENGIPKTDELLLLGLEDVNSKLQELR